MTVGEWDKRQLCPDGGCIGVIGPSGTCKVCGRAAPNWGDERKRGLITNRDQDDAEEDDADLEDGEDEDLETDAADDAEAEADDEIAPGTPATMGNKVPSWSKRRLCPDGGCIGVIGKNGVCNVCGKSAEAEKPARKKPPTGKVEAHKADKADDADGDSDASGTPDKRKAVRDEDDSEDDAEDGDDDEDEVGDDEVSDDEDGDEDGDEDEDEDDVGDDDEDGDDEDSDVDHDDERRASSDDDDDDVVDEDGLRASDTRPAYSDALDDRQLCPDGGCVGVIGKNGKCKVCGKAAA